VRIAALLRVDAVVSYCCFCALAAGVTPRKARPRPPRPENRVNRKKLYNTIPAPEADESSWQTKVRTRLCCSINSPSALQAGIIVERVPLLFPEREPWEEAMHVLRKQRSKNPRTIGRVRCSARNAASAQLLCAAFSRVFG
jgi:hypothetical protein